jgi:Tol biopolymer transport system component
MICKGLWKTAILACASAGCLPGMIPSPAPIAEQGEWGTTLQKHPERLIKKGGAVMVHDIQQHTFADIGDVMDVDVSPDGMTLAFAGSMHSYQPDLYLKTLHGKSISRKSNDPNHAYLWPKFSPRGDLLAFASDRSGNWDLYMMSVKENRPPVQLTHGRVDEVHPSWFERVDAEGKVIERKLAYCARNELTAQWEIWMLDLLTMTPSYLTDGLFPEWSPEGAVVAFQRARGRDTPWYSIWTIDVRNHLESEIIADADWATINPAWSRDGQFIAFATVHKSPESFDRGTRKGDDIWIVSVDGNLRVQVTSDVEADSSPVWGPDNTLYYIREKEGHKNVWSVKPLILDLLR